MDVKLFQYYLLKRWFFPYWIVLAPLLRTVNRLIPNIIWPLKSMFLIILCYPVLWLYLFFIKPKLLKDRTILHLNPMKLAYRKCSVKIWCLSFSRLLIVLDWDIWLPQPGSWFSILSDWSALRMFLIHLFKRLNIYLEGQKRKTPVVLVKIWAANSRHNLGVNWKEFNKGLVIENGGSVKVTSKDGETPVD